MGLNIDLDQAAPGDRLFQSQADRCDYGERRPESRPVFDLQRKEHHRRCDRSDVPADQDPAVDFPELLIRQVQTRSDFLDCAIQISQAIKPGQACIYRYGRVVTNDLSIVIATNFLIRAKSGHPHPQ